MNTSHQSQTEKPLEPMADFFTARLDSYEEHMRQDGYEWVYEKYAGLVPPDTQKVLDLGCGTGLELDYIFKRLPHLSVTGIDLAPAMLDRLKQKHPAKDLTLICGSYFDIALGNNVYDTVIAHQTLHHFSHEQKVGLYRNILSSLKPGCIYLECDYIAKDQAQEDAYYAENARTRREQNIPEGAFYHFDTPCTAETQLSLLKQAGFSSVELVFHGEHYAVIRAKK